MCCIADHNIVCHILNNITTQTKLAGPQHQGSGGVSNPSLFSCLPLLSHGDYRVLSHPWRKRRLLSQNRLDDVNTAIRSIFRHIYVILMSPPGFLVSREAIIKQKREEPKKARACRWNYYMLKTFGGVVVVVNHTHQQQPIEVSQASCHRLPRQPKACYTSTTTIQMVMHYQQVQDRGTHRRLSRRLPWDRHHPPSNNPTTCKPRLWKKHVP